MHLSPDGPVLSLLAASTAPGGWQAVFTGIVVAATLLAILFVQRSPDMAMIGGVVALLVAGVLTPQEAFRA